jgi:MYXO-CTERM domain-containing protein
MMLLIERPVLPLSLRRVALNPHVDVVEPSWNPRLYRQADTSAWKNTGYGVVFFKTDCRPTGAARARSWGMALLLIVAAFGVALLFLALASAEPAPLPRAGPSMTLLFESARASR